MKRVLVFLAMFPWIVSCHPHKEEPGPVENTDNMVTENPYYPLKVGNYWVYENVRVFADGHEETVYSIDSIAVTRDTLFKGKKYAVIEGEYAPFMNEFRVSAILRDSAGYIINQYGQVQFSSVNFTDTLDVFYYLPSPGDTFLIRKRVMESAQVTTRVTQAGTFDVLTCLQKNTYPNKLSGNLLTTWWNSEFAKGVGPVITQWNYQFADVSGEWKDEKRLLRYRAEFRP